MIRKRLVLDDRSDLAFAITIQDDHLWMKVKEVKDLKHVKEKVKAMKGMKEVSTEVKMMEVKEARSKGHLEDEGGEGEEEGTRDEGNGGEALR